MDRERLIDEVLMLMPTLMRAIGSPAPEEMAEFASRGVPTDVRISPGRVQILIALTRGPHSVGRLAEALGVSPPVAANGGHGAAIRRGGPDVREGFEVVGRGLRPCSGSCS